MRQNELCWPAGGFFAASHASQSGYPPDDQRAYEASFRSLQSESTAPLMGLYGRIVSLKKILLNLRVVLALVVSLPMLGCSNRDQQAAELGQLAASQLEAGQIQAARRSINEAIEKRDDISDLHLLRARIEVRAGAFAAAFSAYSNALALDSSNLEALDGVAQLGLRTSNLRASEAATDQLLIINPRNINALTLKGLQLLIRKKASEAVAITDRILAMDPLHEAGTILKARALYQLDRGEEGLRLILTLDSKIKPRSDAIASTLLEFYRERNDARGMLEQYAVLKRFRPDDIDLRIDEANARYKLGHVAEARSLLQSALGKNELSIAQAEAISRLWSEYDRSPLDQSGLQTLQTKANPGVRQTLARYFLDEGKSAPALSILSGLENNTAKALRGRARVASGATEEGLKEAESVLKRDKGHCDALVAKAEGLLASKEIEKAVEAAQLASATCPQMTGAYLALAEAHSRLDNPSATNRVFADALANNSQSSRLTRTFVGWLEANGEQTRAIAIARRLTNKAPALVSGWTLLAELCSRSDDSACTADADAGLVAAKARLAIDLPPGENLANSLFGRLRR